MEIRVHNETRGIISYSVWTEESRHISDEEELRQCMKKLFSAMKKDGRLYGISFQLCSDDGFYVVVSRYDSDSEAYETTFCHSCNNRDTPIMKSQKNVLAMALDILKSDTSAA